MQPIQLTGLQIVESRRMKQSGRRRLLIELTEADTKKYGAALTAWEDNELIFNSDLQPSEVQGNNNGYEKATLSGQGSIYQQFKSFCDKYGIDYAKQKEELGVAHLHQLEEKHSFEEIVAMLKERMFLLERKLGLYS